MPNKQSGKKNKTKTLGDVTINDFANSSVCKNRTKKVNAVTILKSFEEEKTWDEKVNDFDGEFVEVENEDGSVSYVINKIEPRRRKKTISQDDNAIVQTGNEYPIDIWFLISEYIRPEDVGRFAAICKSTYTVTSSAKFWFNLYRRYYCRGVTMPEQLQPECLVRKYSLKSAVVRALHYTYTPFVNRLKINTEDHPDKVAKRECILMWHEKKKSNWYYYFKLKEKRLISPPPRHIPALSQPDLLEILDDVLANQDEHCRVLQITCKHFIPVPPVLGLTLSSVLFTLSAGFINHKLQLSFDSGILRTADGGTGVSVVLDPVINVKVLDWWHPLYPHSHSMGHLLNQE